MSDSIEIYKRSLNEVSLGTMNREVSDPDSILVLPVAKVAALVANPVGGGIDSVAQLVGLCGGRVVGQHSLLRLRLCADDARYETICGSGLFLAEGFRNTFLGVKLIAQPADSSSDGIVIGCGLSQQAIKVYRGLRFLDFQMPRLLLLCRSRAVVEKLPLPRLLQRFVILSADLCLHIQRVLLSALAHWRSRGFHIEQIDVIPDDIAGIMAGDRHRFRFERPREWFQWQLDRRFSDHPSARNRFWIIRDQTGTAVGFFAGKLRFHASASQRDFRNVVLGSVTEWQTCNSNRLSHASLILFCTLALAREGADAVEICSDDHAVISQMQHLGMIRLGELNFVLSAKQNSPLRKHAGFDQQSNWRLRPADGDNGLS
jgi:hypothetical protein